MFSPSNLIQWSMEGGTYITLFHRVTIQKSFRWRHCVSQPPSHSASTICYATCIVIGRLNNITVTHTWPWKLCSKSLCANKRLVYIRLVYICLESICLVGLLLIYQAHIGYAINRCCIIVGLCNTMQAKRESNIGSVSFICVIVDLMAGCTITVYCIFSESK